MSSPNPNRNVISKLIILGRYRTAFMTHGSILAFILLLLIDPDAGLIRDLVIGARPITEIATALRVIWYVALLHFGRKALLDYIDFETVAKEATGSPVGAGLLTVGIGLVYIAIAILIHSVAA